MTVFDEGIIGMGEKEEVAEIVVVVVVVVVIM
jgi:hypothetical protein